MRAIHVERFAELASILYSTKSTKLFIVPSFNVDKQSELFIFGVHITHVGLKQSIFFAKHS